MLYSPELNANLTLVTHLNVMFSVVEVNEFD